MKKKKKSHFPPPSHRHIPATVGINRSHGCRAGRAVGFYGAIFLFNNTTRTHTHSLEQVTVYRSEFNPGRPLGETTPCSEDQNKIYYFCLEILPSLHFRQAQGNLTSAISLHFKGMIASHSQICSNRFNLCILHRSFKTKDEGSGFRWPLVYCSAVFFPFFL